MHGSIVVIDDDDDLLDSLSEYIKFRGFDVVGTGHNGLEAVALYEKYRPNLVLMNISMSNYDGIYGIENIKKINPDAKVIILTGRYNRSVEQKSNLFNVILLEKPCPLKQLERILISSSKH